MHKGVLAAVALTLGLVAILAVQFEQETFTKKEADNRLNKPIINPNTLKNLTSFTIKQGETSFTIKKGKTWTLSHSSFPADTENIVTLFSDLTKAKAMRVVAVSQKDFPSLELTDAKAKIVTIEAGDDSTTLRIGKDRTNGSGFYFAFQGEEKAYESSASVQVETDENAWESKELFQWMEDATDGLTVSLINGKKAGLSFKKNGENWTLTAGANEGDSPNSNNITEYVETISELSFDEKMEKTDGFHPGKPLYSFKINSGSSTVSLQITQKDNGEASKTYYIVPQVDNPETPDTKNLSELSKKWVFQIEEYKINSLKEEVSHFLSPTQDAKESATKTKSEE